MNRSQLILAISGILLAMLPAFFPLWDAEVTVRMDYEVREDGEWRDTHANLREKMPCRGFIFSGPSCSLQTVMQRIEDRPDILGGIAKELDDDFRNKRFRISKVEGDMRLPRMLLEIGVIVIPIALLAVVLGLSPKKRIVEPSTGVDVQ